MAVLAGFGHAWNAAYCGRPYGKLERALRDDKVPLELLVPTFV